MLLDYPVHRFRPGSAPALPLALWQVQPPLLTEIHIQGPPGALELLHRLPEHGFAVVGTRRPQARSLETVHSMIARLRGSPLIILSGLALGIDSAAHEAALRAGLPTIAILGSSLDDIYPQANRELARAILETGGLLVSEFAEGTQLQKHFFIRRNRIIAGWAKAAWIVEASHRSGALNTARHALDQGIDRYVTPCYPGDPALAGNERLLSGNEATALWTLEDLESTWKELKGLKGARRQCAAPTPDAVHSDEQLLTHEVLCFTKARGGVRVEELLDWAMNLAWPPDRFFAALQTALDARLISDQAGILNAARTPYT